MTDSTTPGMREILLGEVSLGYWAEAFENADEIPVLQGFGRARNFLAAGDQAAAIGALMGIVNAAGLESRHYVVAWKVLRELKQMPEGAEGKHLLGVVLEVGMPKGFDLLAAYPEGAARYLNFSRSGVVVEPPAPEGVQKWIDALLEAGRNIVSRIGPWEGAFPPVVKTGLVRMTFLTPSGPHFGQGAFEHLLKDPLGGEVLRCGTELMRALVAIKK